VDEPNPRHWQYLGLAASFPTCISNRYNPLRHKNMLI
jgi:hypothetical protein